MTLHLDALRRDISRRLAISSEDEVRVVDLFLLHVERSRHARLDEGGVLLDTSGDHSDLEKAYRRGHNDAMRSETPQVSLWRTRVLLATRTADVERGLAELRRNAQSDEEQAEKVDAACKVCDARPGIDGEREHGRGCYVVSEDGGGSDYPVMSGVVDFDLSEMD